MGVRVREHKGIWYVFVNLGGRRRAQAVGPNKRLANAIAARVRRKIARGEYTFEAPKAPAMTFALLAREWLERYALTHGVRPSTMENYTSFVTRHLIPYFGTLPVTEIGPDTIEAFIVAKRSPGGSARFQGKALSPQSLRVGLVALRLILRRAVGLRLLSANPAADIGRIPRIDGQTVDPFTAGEVRAILDGAERAVSPDFATLLRLWAQAGMRAGEVLGLQDQDLDLAAGTAVVRRTLTRGRLGPVKAGGPRRVSFLHPTTEDTQEWRPGSTPGSWLVLERLKRRKVSGIDPAAFVFGRGTAPYRSHDLHRDWRRALLAAGVRYREPEQLRHTFASAMLSRNAPLLYVAEAGGWSSAHTLLKVYARWLPSRTGVDTLPVHVPATQAQPQQAKS